MAQEPAQSLAAPHRSFALPIVYPRKQQDVALPLMVPLGMEMVDMGWLGRQDSNLGMEESKSSALPLGYAPKITVIRRPDHNDFAGGALLRPQAAWAAFLRASTCTKAPSA